MYNKDELLSKSITDLGDIAKELGVDITPGTDLESAVYTILDQQAITAGSQNPMGTKRKRTRIVKKDTDRVYTVSGKEGENFDLKKNKVTADTAPLFKEKTEEIAVPAAEEAPVVEKQAEAPEAPAAPKRRGRKSKAEAAAIAAAEAEEAAIAADASADVNNPDASVVEEQPAANDVSTVEDMSAADQQSEASFVEENNDFVPEAQFANAINDENEESRDLLAQLQEKVNAHNDAEGASFGEVPLEGESSLPPEAYEEYVDAVWEGDPADGTDFITIVDLPIEDQTALPSYDIFDNPTMPINSRQSFTTIPHAMTSVTSSQPTVCSK